MERFGAFISDGVYGSGSVQGTLPALVGIHRFDGIIFVMAETLVPIHKNQVDDDTQDVNQSIVMK